DVIVPAGDEAFDAVRRLVARRQQEHRYVHTVLTQAFEECHAVEVREHDVEHDEVWSYIADDLSRVAAVMHLRGFEALVAQRGTSARWRPLRPRPDRSHLKPGRCHLLP